eukprot:2890474-Pleurochrysis_carterae.AAC.1
MSRRGRSRLAVLAEHDRIACCAAVRLFRRLRHGCARCAAPLRRVHAALRAAYTSFILSYTWFTLPYTSFAKTVNLTAR